MKGSNLFFMTFGKKEVLKSMHQALLIRTLIFMIGLLLLPTVHAQSQDSFDKTLLNMPLEQLLQVSVASKRLESVNDAPSVITVISADDIRRYGARHLRDIIDRLPNSLVIGSTNYPHNRTSLRGVTQTHLDDKILILLNGRPIRDAGQGGVNGDIYSSFPVNLILQIEIIRGPGSVLYGTNAFSGVINIVTKQPEEPAEFQIETKYGSYKTKEVDITGGAFFEDFRFMGALNTHHSDGDSFTNTTGEFGPDGNYETGKKSAELVAQSQYKQLNINVIINKVEQKAGNNLLTFPSEYWTIERRFIDIGYRMNLNEHWHLQTNITYNGMNNTAGIIGGTGRFFTTKSRGYLGELSLHGNINKNTDIVIGGVYDWLKGNNVSDGTRNTEIDTWRSSFYSQLDYLVNHCLKLNGGFQLNKPEGGDNDIAPRIASIITFNNNYTLKLMYDEAYRSPFGLDLFLDAAFLLGNPNLKPETIDTYSAQLIYTQQDFNVASTYYTSRHENLIVRTIDDSGQVTLTNQGHVDYEGIELEYDWNLTQNWSATGNISYQTNETEMGDNDTTFHPNWMIKSGISYDANGYLASLFVSYFGEPTQTVKLNPAVNEANPKAESYTLITANIAFDLSRVFNNTNYDGLTFSIYGDNLLDEQVHSPEISRLTVNSIPSHNGRGFYATLVYQF